MSTQTLLVVAVFDALLVWTLCLNTSRKKMLTRTLSQWAVDCIGLIMHGLFVPLFQMGVIYALLSKNFATYRGCITLNPFLAFMISFIVIDYIYYWNHRLLHSDLLWRFHALHHSGSTFDIFTTSRNSLFSSFFVLYIWVNGALLFFLKNSEAFAWGIAIGNALDILRHAGFGAWFKFWPFSWVISPKEHAWHHSTDKFNVNFGGNLNLWDKVHGTYYHSDQLPEKTGSELSSKLWSAFWKGAPSG